MSESFGNGERKMFLDRYTQYLVELNEEHGRTNGKLTKDDVDPVLDLTKEYFDDLELSTQPDIMRLRAVRDLDVLLDVTITHDRVSAYLGKIIITMPSETTTTISTTAEADHIFDVEPLKFVDWFMDCVTAIDLKKLPKTS